MGPLNRNEFQKKYLAVKEDILSNDKLGFSIVYQPKVDIINRNIISWEILSRWYHPEFGLVSPIEFIEIIRDLDKEYEFDIHVFEKMCKDIIKSNCSYNTYSINISINTLKNSNIYDDILNITKKYSINPKQIILEILETDPINEYEGIIETINKLDERGYKISIDDFGTGYSSYYRLCNINFGEIKIPREFLPKPSDNKEKKIKVLRGIVDMGRSLGCKVVIEGIETQDDHNIAMSLGIDYGQGYLYSRPVPFNKYTEMIKI
ncbi:EAL domain-containing protein [[Clostridium] dakarense]|uniref:EAL domain-containing protein n=1 Tax=Faecalimicrobium dakarense TaxID=1301100 RepID=UPI0004B8BD64|nr:EAL domain-containing protein [[Clostridium] dakarense]